MSNDPTAQSSAAPPPAGATIEEVKPDDSITSAFAANQADLFIKTGKTGGKRFLVKVNSGAGRASLIALHL